MAENRAWKSSATASARKTEIRCGRKWALRGIGDHLGAIASQGRSTWATWPSACTPASGARPAPMDHALDLAMALHGRLQGLLHRKPVGLALPSDKGGAVVLDG